MSIGIPGMARTKLIKLCVALLWSTAAIAADDEYVHLVREGETLEAIARDLAGDVRQWSKLQQINQVRDPRRIPVGTSLRIPLDLMRLGRGTAQVAYLTGAVMADGVALGANQRVPEGAQIVTGENGFVTLILPDDSHVAVPPNSSIKLDFLKRSAVLPIVRSQISIERGRVESHVIPDGTTAPRLKIKTRQAVVGVRGTVFRVAVDERAAHDAATRTEVIEGSVYALAQTPEAEARIVPTGFGMTFDGGAARVEALSPAPDLSALAPIQNRPILRVPFPAMPGATAFRVTVSTEEQNRTPFAEGVFALGTEAKFAGIPDGDYWIKVRAIAERGLEGKDAVRKIQLAAHPEPPFLMQPAPAAKVQPGEIRFQWTQSSDAKRYRFELSNDPAFPTDVTTVQDVASVSHVEAALAPGRRYYWRIASITAAGKQGPFSDPQDFSIVALRSPIAAPTQADGKLKFSWSQDPGQRHQFQFARDQGFTDLVHEFELDLPEVSIPMPAAGRYYTRTRAIDADGFIGPYTPVQHIEIPASFPWWIFTPLLLML